MVSRQRRILHVLRSLVQAEWEIWDSHVETGSVSALLKHTFAEKLRPCSWTVRDFLVL